MVRSSAANAGDVGSGPDRGSFHALGQLNPCSATAEPLLSSSGARTAVAGHLEPALHSKRSHRGEKPEPCNESAAPLSAARGSPCSNTGPARSEVRK